MIRLSIRYINLVFTISVLTSCGGDQLPKPDLLNHPQVEWAKRTAAMTTEDLFYIYRYHLSLKPPYNTGFAKYLGNRGKEAIELWIVNLETGQQPQIEQYYLYSPLIQQAYYRGGYDLCADAKTLNRAAEALMRPIRAYNINEPLTQIKGACVK